jgi:Right handed beta helix region
MKFRSCRTAVAFVGCMVLGSSLAFAQLTRSWVSGVGDDANPCSRTAPCKTFAGAISKTAAGGEISVLDPGGYGAVTITKPITISGVGPHSSILASGTTGVLINITTTPTAPQTPTVTLRNLQINGAGTVLGIHGVRVISTVATTVILDHVNVFGFTTNGVISEGANKVSISGGVFSNNTGIALHSIGSSTLSVENAEINGNNTAVQADLGSQIRLTNNGVYDNKTGFACGTGGTLASAGNNRKAGNVGGVIPTCTPTVVITVQ